MNKPIHIIGRSRLDNWNFSKLTSNNQSKFLDKPILIHAHSVIDNWQSNLNLPTRSHSVPTSHDEINIELQQNKITVIYSFIRFPSLGIVLSFQ